MQPRNSIPQAIRNALSKLHYLINKKRLIRGSLVYLRNKCGKPNCKCTRGEKHISLYIRKTVKGKPKMTLIPRVKWDEIKQLNDRYKEIQQLLEQISDYEWQRIKEQK